MIISNYIISRLDTNGYPDFSEVWSRPKMPLSTRLLSYPDSREFLSYLGSSAKNATFHHYMRGARVGSTLGWNSTSPEGHERMVADLAVLCRREKISQSSGSPHDGKACRTQRKKGWEPRVLSFLSWPICPLLAVLFY